MADKEDVCPLSPANVFPVSDAPTSDNNKNTLRRPRTRIKWLICVAVTFLILLTLALTLIFTVFKVKDPIITLNGVTINGLGSTTGLPTQFLGKNISMIVDLSVKNPNSSWFKYSNTTTDIYYKGTVFGEAHGPPGKARPYRTSRMNMTVDIMMDRILSDPGMGLAVFGSGLMEMWSYTKVSGKAKILGILKKHVTVKMNCTMAVNVRSQSVQGVKCKKKFHF